MKSFFAPPLTFSVNSVQEFFGQLDQRVLSVFLKACDDLTDILPEEEQQALQDTVRTLHKQWKVRQQSLITFIHTIVVMAVFMKGVKCYMILHGVTIAAIL